MKTKTPVFKKGNGYFSQTAVEMGAKISVSGPPQGLYLVIGSGPIVSLVNRVGGQIAMRFTADKLLAILSYDGFLALKRESMILRVGPVNLDMERFKKLSQGLSKSVVPSPGAI